MSEKAKKIAKTVGLTVAGAAALGAAFYAGRLYNAFGTVLSVWEYLEEHPEELVADSEET